MNNERIVALLGVTVDFTVPLLFPLAKEMQKIGWDVHLVSSSGQNSYSIPVGEGLSHHQIQMNREPSFYSDFRALLQWLRLVSNLKPDVALIGTPKASLLGLLACWIHRVPLRVYHLRGLRLESENGLLRSVLKKFEAITSGLSHFVLSVSPSLKSRYDGLGISDPKKTIVLGRGSSIGVNLKRFEYGRQLSSIERLRTQNELGLRPNIPVVGFFGRITEEKGIATFIEALESPLLDSVVFQVLVVGPDESQGLWTKLKDQSSRTIIEVGHHTQIEKLYALLDVLCLPTHREGLPNVALEAQASGVPVVTTDATGAIDSVLHGVTGVVIKTHSRNELALALALLLNTPALRATMGQNGRRWVSENFAQEAVISKQIELLKSELRRRKSR